MQTVVREVAQGQVRGELVSDGGVARFLGIPYGASTDDTGRFLPPRPAAAWSGVRDCLAFGAAAPQPANDFGPTDRAKALSAMIEAGGDGEPQSEDCLVLNVWTPAAEPAAPRPVMVWIHGGAFTIGSGAAPYYDGTVLADRHDVVVVTINHRLGALGYLYLAELLGDAYALSGNVGQLDIIAALEWVQTNAASFGGDPDNVTIFGESGGGSKISCLMAMPAAAGLFHRALIQSGPRLRTLTTDIASDTARAVLTDLGLSVDDAKQLLDVPVDALIESQLRVLGGPLGGILTGGRTLQPVVDGVALPNQPWVAGAPSVSSSVPLLIGTVKDEMSLFVYPNEALDDVDDEGVGGALAQLYGDRAAGLHAAYRAARPDAIPRQHLIAALSDRYRIGSIIMAERRVQQGGAPVWMYRFDFETEVFEGALGAPHALDVPYVFGDPDSMPLTGTRPGRHELADIVCEAWATFARHGDPRTAALADWAPYDMDRRSTMILDLPPRAVDDPDADERRAWGDLLPIGV